MKNAIYISDKARERLLSFARHKDEPLSDVAERIIMMVPKESDLKNNMEEILKKELAAVSPQLANTLTGKHYGSEMSLDYKKELLEELTNRLL